MATTPTVEIPANAVIEALLNQGRAKDFDLAKAHAMLEQQQQEIQAQRLVIEEYESRYAADAAETKESPHDDLG